MAENMVLSQTEDCPTFLKALKRYKIKPAKCVHCSHPNLKEDECRFRGFRRLSWPKGKPTQVTTSFEERLDRHPQIPHVFNNSVDFVSRNRIKVASANYLLPILRREKSHLDSPGVISRAREVETRVTCDQCGTSLFAATWFCTSCGRELCGTCAGTPPSSACHPSTILQATTRFSKEELESAIADMSSVLMVQTQADGPLDSFGKETENASRAVTRLNSRGLSLDDFRRIWSKSTPFVVKGVKFQVPWGPNYFIDNYGHEICHVEDCQSLEQRETTVKDFFELYGVRRECHQIQKLKDWPPTENFAKAFPELHQDFLKAVPLSEYTGPDGFLNIAAHFPLNGVRPDLGPKMYNAFATAQDNNHFGSTRLHLDLTDAVNIMTHSSAGHDGYAVWHVFRSEDAPSLRRFILGLSPAKTTGDPIHNQETYLTPELLGSLYDTENVQPYEIHQHPGEAVFIPAGCAHQVSNQSDAIKIACDFVTAQNLDKIQRLSREFRQQRLEKGWPEDVLQLDLMLWYAWRSSNRVPDSSGTDDRDIGMALEEDQDMLPAFEEDDVQMETHADQSPHAMPNASTTAAPITPIDTISGATKKTLRRKARRKADKAAGKVRIINVDAKLNAARAAQRPIYYCPWEECPRFFSQRDGVVSHCQAKHYPGKSYGEDLRASLLRITSVEELREALRNLC